MARTSTGNSKADLAERIAKAVGAGKVVAMETVDFSDPNRPKTCLEVDFPILPVNQVAAIEGNAGKPIYQMSKWWARRRSSVFRSMLIAAATKAPDDPSEAAKKVWSNYYANHQKRGAFKHLKVADIFMGGGTTIVEGARLGMQMYGNDLNPVAWFIVKNEMAQVKKEEVEALLADIEAEVKPAIQPFYTCDCPRGHKGVWTDLRTGKKMPAEFRGWQVPVEERKHYKYSGPEIIYVFWAKHGPCQVTGCGHRTPLFSSPVMAVKDLTVKSWRKSCPRCEVEFDVEQHSARMAPGVPLTVAEDEPPFAVMDDLGVYHCPSCRAPFQDRKARESGTSMDLGKAKNKKVVLALLVHPEWQAGEAGVDEDGRVYGGSVTDDAESTARWNQARARKIRLLEVRGKLPEEVTCPETGVRFSTTEATIPKRSNYACGACGTVQDVLTTIKRSGKSGPIATYGAQCYCPDCDKDGRPYGGRFLAPASDSSSLDRAHHEWAMRRNDDLAEWWPKSELPYGFMTHSLNGGIPNHGFTHWWTMFNSRQLLTHAQLIRAVMHSGEHRDDVRRFVLGSGQQFLRNQCMFSFWHQTLDKLAPALSNSNFHPKSTVIEVGSFAPMGYGPWPSTTGPLEETLDWLSTPWDVASNRTMAQLGVPGAEESTAQSTKMKVGDSPIGVGGLSCGSSTDLAKTDSNSLDLVITDPPFGGLLHYSELSDFFYVWLRLALKDRFPAEFGPEYTPKTLEAVANRARNPGEGEADAWYQKLLTAAWRESHRILKPGGILAFTFHHSEDEPWVAVLESLFDAGFYLEATYPIRSDETKGEGEFGSKKIEYDIIHVCRKRTEEPTFTSWARMRRAILADVKQLQTVLEAHQQQGLPAADLQVIRRGKALEYFSRHYGKVYTDAGKDPMTVQEALAGITDLLDDESSGKPSTLPPDLEPMTRQFLRMFQGETELARDQVQKYLRGTGIAPSDFEAKGWCREVKKVVQIVPPLEAARAWVGKHRKGMTSDFDQATYLIGACIDGSGINAQDTLNNESFRAHRTLEPLLTWFAEHATVGQTRIAARRALTLLTAWRAKQVPRQRNQLDLLFDNEAL